MNENVYNYYILKDKNLVIEILRGDFEINDFINLKKENPKILTLTQILILFWISEMLRMHSRRTLEMIWRII